MSFRGREEIRNFFRFFLLNSRRVVVRRVPCTARLWFAPTANGRQNGTGPGTSVGSVANDSERISGNARICAGNDFSQTSRGPVARGFIRPGRDAAYRPSLPANDRRVVSAREMGPGIGETAAAERSHGMSVDEAREKKTASDQQRPVSATPPPPSPPEHTYDRKVKNIKKRKTIAHEFRRSSAESRTTRPPGRRVRRRGRHRIR